MNTPAADLSETVAYSMDKCLINRIPWALWSCVAGLVKLNTSLGTTAVPPQSRPC